MGAEFSALFVKRCLVALSGLCRPVWISRMTKPAEDRVTGEFNPAGRLTGCQTRRDGTRLRARGSGVPWRVRHVLTPSQRALPGEHQDSLRPGGGRRRRQHDSLLRRRDRSGLHGVRAARPDRAAPRSIERRHRRRMVQAESMRIHQDLRQHVLQSLLPEEVGGPGSRPRQNFPSRLRQRAKPSTAASPTISSPRSPRGNSSRNPPVTSVSLQRPEVKNTGSRSASSGDEATIPGQNHGSRDQVHVQSTRRPSNDSSQHVTRFCSMRQDPHGFVPVSERELYAVQ